jgi:hypothetical protein
MSAGQLRHDATGTTRTFYATVKWKWWLLRLGLGSFKRAKY